MAKFVVNNAELKCSCGTASSKLKVGGEHNWIIENQNAANIGDHIPIKNICPFGNCTNTANPAVAAALGAPQPCIPVTPNKWSPGAKEFYIDKEQVLDDVSTCQCIYGGVISVADAGQESWFIDNILPSGSASESNEEKTQQPISEEMPQAVDDAKEAAAPVAIANGVYGQDGQPVNKMCRDGEPVNVVTGQEVLQQTDFVVSGDIPFNWVRTYKSGSSATNSIVGYGWSVSYSDYLEESSKYTTYTDAEGRKLVFDTPAIGESFLNRFELATLYKIDEESSNIVFKDGKTLCFTGKDKIKHLVSEKDKYGNSLDFRYDEENRLSEVHLSTWKIASLEYNEEGRLDCINRVGQKGTVLKAASYEYNKTGDLVKITDACGFSELFEYENHLFKKRTLKTGFNFYFQWDKIEPSGRCLRSYGDDGSLIQDSGMIQKIR